MQTSILTLMLALGLPGANSCNAQSQDLPRVGQNPPVATHGHDHDTPDTDDADDEADDDAEGADDDVAEMDGGDCDEAEGMEELAEIAALEAEGDGCSEAQAKSDCKPHCQGGGACEGQPNAKLSRALTQLQGLGYLNDAQLQGLTLKREQLGMNPQTAMVLGSNGAPLLRYRIAQAAPQGQQDERVRELEQRVRELEAQLRERDGQRGRSAPRSFNPLGYAGEAQGGRDEAALERARAGEMRQRMSAQARDYADQARRQAQELRKHGEQLRKQALEQAEQWRVHSEGMANDMHKWKLSMIPPTPGSPATEPDLFVETGPGGMTMRTPSAVELPAPAEAPEAVAVPEIPLTTWWARSPSPTAPRTKAPKPPKPGKTAKGASPAQTAEMQAMLEQMRAQMDEMRVQMQALREELQNAPQREMR